MSTQVMRIQDSPFNLNPVTSSNHNQGYVQWVLKIREVARGRKPFIPQEELAQLLKDDPLKGENVAILRLTTAAILKGKKAKDQNYYLISKKGTSELWGAFAVGEDKVSAPAASNISSRHYCSPFVFEIRDENRCLEKMLVTIIGNKLEIIGNRKELISFLSQEGRNDLKIGKKQKGETESQNRANCPSPKKE